MNSGARAAQRQAAADGSVRSQPVLRPEAEPQARPARARLRRLLGPRPAARLGQPEPPAQGPAATPLVPLRVLAAHGPRQLRVQLLPVSRDAGILVVERSEDRPA